VAHAQRTRENTINYNPVTVCTTCATCAISRNKWNIINKRYLTLSNGFPLLKPYDRQLQYRTVYIPIPPKFRKRTSNSSYRRKSSSVTRSNYVRAINLRGGDIDRKLSRPHQLITSIPHQIEVSNEPVVQSTRAE